MNYVVNEGSSVYKFESYDDREWWQRSYTMDSEWDLVSTSTSREVGGVNLNRFTFDLPNLNKYSHFVFRVYIRYGVCVFVNGVRYFVDNVSLYSIDCR